MQVLPSIHINCRCSNTTLYQYQSDKANATTTVNVTARTQGEANGALCQLESVFHVAWLASPLALSVSLGGLSWVVKFIPQLRQRWLSPSSIAAAVIVVVDLNTVYEAGVGDETLLFFGVGEEPLVEQHVLRRPHTAGVEVAPRQAIKVMAEGGERLMRFARRHQPVVHHPHSSRLPILHYGVPAAAAAKIFARSWVCTAAQVKRKIELGMYVVPTYKYQMDNLSQPY